MKTETDTCFSQSALVNVAKHIPNVMSATDEEKLFAGSFVEPNYEIVEMDMSCFEMTDQHKDLLDEFDFSHFKERINQEGLKYIAGYVAHRFRDKYTNLGTLTKELTFIKDEPDWLPFISRGKLLYPSDELMEVARTIEAEFNKFHGNSLSYEKFIFSKLASKTMEKLPHINIAQEVVLCFARTRTRLEQENKPQQYRKEIEM